MELNDLLRRAVDAGASDIHLKLDRPPMLRRDGAVAPLEGADPLTEADLVVRRGVDAGEADAHDLLHPRPFALRLLCHPRSLLGQI